MNKRNVILAGFAIITQCVLVAVCLFTIELFRPFYMTILLPILPNRQEPHIEMAHSRVQIGDERDKAVQAMSDAWYHSECFYDSSLVEDLFFYGPRDRDKVKVVLIRSENVDGKAVVFFVGGIESYMLHLYERCFPSPLDAFDGDEPTVTSTP